MPIFALSPLYFPSPFRQRAAAAFDYTMPIFHFLPLFSSSSMRYIISITLPLYLFSHAFISIALFRFRHWYLRHFDAFIESYFRRWLRLIFFASLFNTSFHYTYFISRHFATHSFSRWVYVFILLSSSCLHAIIISSATFHWFHRPFLRRHWFRFSSISPIADIDHFRALFYFISRFCWAPPILSREPEPRFLRCFAAASSSLRHFAAFHFLHCRHIRQHFFHWSFSNSYCHSSLPVAGWRRRQPPPRFHFHDFLRW